MSDQRITSVEARSRGYGRDAIARIELQEEASADAAALIPLIVAAFEGVPRPRITLRVARGFDVEWNLTDARIAELGAYDPEERWQNVTDEAIEHYQEYFNFSDAEGWRFYLPAFMCHYLRGFPECGWEGVYYACEVPQHTGLLDEAQMECLMRFRDLCRKHEEHEHDWPSQGS